MMHENNSHAGVSNLALEFAALKDEERGKCNVELNLVCCFSHLGRWPDI